MGSDTMKMKHPLTAAVYEDEADGSVRVTETDGRQGWFSVDGRYLRGEVRAADPHILDWVGGRKAKRQLGRLRLGSENATTATDNAQRSTAE
jgi:hypothetical protein